MTASLFPTPWVCFMCQLALAPGKMEADLVMELIFRGFLLRAFPIRALHGVSGVQLVDLVLDGLFEFHRQAHDVDIKEAAHNG